MLLSSLLKLKSKNYRKIPIKGISFDSRNVKKGHVFFAIEGKKTSGIQFIKQAISKGASAIVSSNKLVNKKYKIPFLLVDDVRKSLAESSSKLYTKSNTKNTGLI